MKKSTVLLCFSLVSFFSLQAAEYTLLENNETYPILNPTLAERKTAKIILENGIQAYLVSDPKTDQSAAAVCMETGSWEDPAEYPGTAHFLEHMLFLGTKAYPNESEYMKYIKDNGGGVNAFTASDRTVYMFSINNNAFTGAFDRFSHFFLDPLFNSSCINRELLAVDQEFSKNVENDSWRSYMVLKETGNKDHPNVKFSIGNKETLSGIPQEVLKTWYQTHYRPDKMHVAMLSPLSLDEMTHLLSEQFSSIPEKPAIASPSYGSILSAEQKGHFLYIKPVKDLKIISLVWELPKEFAPVDQLFTGTLISYVFNDASDQSLLCELKKQKLADSISCDANSSSKEDRFFSIDISLTDQGLSQIDTVISLCYQTLARLRQNGIPLSLFKEVDTMAKIRYQYQSKQDPFTWITNIAASLPDENLSTFPEKINIPTAFDSKSLSEFVSSLTPESCVYIVLADPEKLGITLKNTEKWMQVPYSLEEISTEKLSAWKQIGPNPAIQLPPINPFLPESLSLLTSTEQETTSTITPIEIVNNNKSKFYFAQDSQYLLPESAYIFNLKTPAIDGSARSTVLSDLFCKTIYDQLDPILFFANHAGLFCQFSKQNFNFSIHITGYSEKASDLTEKVFTALKKVSCSKEQFLLYKDSLLSSYANESSEIPMKQAIVTAYNILLNDIQTGPEKEQALQEVSFEDFIAFCDTWLDTIYLEGMLYGNLTKELASNLAENLQGIFTNSSPYEDPKKQTLLLLPEDKGPFKVLQQTKRQGNGTVLVIEEGPLSLPKKASQEILASAIQESFFDTLRTKQQTAYLVQSWSSQVDEQLLQIFAVQSSSHLPEDLLHRFELFLEDFCKRLPEFISKEQFALLKDTEMTALQIPPQNIYEMAKELAGLGFYYKGDFSRKENLLEAYKNLTHKDFLMDAETFISKGNARRLAVLVEGLQLPEKPLQYAEIAKEDIVKIGTSSSLQ